MALSFDDLRSIGITDLELGTFVHHDPEQLAEMDILSGPFAQSCQCKHNQCEKCSPVPIALRTELLIEYDVEQYPFSQLLSEVLAPGVRLDRLHETDDVRGWLRDMLSNDSRGHAMRRNIIDKRFKTVGGFKGNDKLWECYISFVRAVIAPMIGDSDGILYQIEPNFRCHLPGTGHKLVKPHRDSDYFHQPNEINFWLPCTTCFGANTLWAESAPGRRDFRPFELHPGQLMRFWGHDCEHFTVPNDTDHCRVSIDFRCIPRKLYRDQYWQSHMGNGLPRFAEGGFFASMAA